MSFHFFLLTKSTELDSQVMFMSLEEAEEQLDTSTIRFASRPISFVEGINLLASFQAFRIDVVDLKSEGPARTFIAEIIGHRWQIVKEKLSQEEAVS